MVELRWLFKKDANALLQVRYALNQGQQLGGFPSSSWSPWKDVPEIKEEEVEPDNLTDALDLLRKMRQEAKKK